MLLVLGSNERNRPEDNEKLKELLQSSINQPSNADIKVSMIQPQKDRTLFREFQQLEEITDIVTFTKTLDTTTVDEASVLIFNEKGRPNARRIILLLVNSTALPSDELINQWNRTFAENDVLVIPVVFGSEDDGDKLRPIAPQSRIHIIEPDDNPAEKGEEIAEDITKGKLIDLKIFYKD